MDACGQQAYRGLGGGCWRVGVLASDTTGFLLSHCDEATRIRLCLVGYFSRFRYGTDGAGVAQLGLFGGEIRDGAAGAQGAQDARLAQQSFDFTRHGRPPRA